MIRHCFFVFSILWAGLGMNSVMAQSVSSGLIHEGMAIQPDKEVFIAGENLYFRLTLFNRSQHESHTVSRFAYLYLRDVHNRSIAFLRYALSNNIAYGMINLPDTLKTGIYQLVSFTNAMRNEGEKSYAVKEILIANRFDKDLTALKFSSGDDSGESRGDTIMSLPAGMGGLIISCARQKFHTRENIDLRIVLPASVNPGASLAVSVYSDPGATLDSGFKSFFGGAGEKDAGVSLEACEYLPETENTVFQGTIHDKNTNNAIAGANVILSIRDSVINLKQTLSDSRGKFCFLLGPYYQNKELVVRVAGYPEAVIVPDDKREIHNDFNPQAQYFRQALKTYLNMNQDREQVNRIYQVHDSIITLPLPVVRKFENRIYHTPDHVVYPSDFVPLNDFAEISRELLPTLKVRKKEEGYIASIFDVKFQMYLDSHPAIFLDGVLIENIGQIISMGTKQVKKLEMISNTMYYGDMKWPGILSVTSMHDEIDHIQWQSNVLKINADQDQPMQKPYFGALKNIPLYQPDLRTVLYWDPNITMVAGEEKILHFAASDCTGSFIVKAEGFTGNGTPITAYYRINVSNH